MSDGERPRPAIRAVRIAALVAAVWTVGLLAVIGLYPRNDDLHASASSLVQILPFLFLGVFAIMFFISYIGERLKAKTETFEKQIEALQSQNRAKAIINRYGAVLEKFAGHMVVNDKHLPASKDEIKRALLDAISLETNPDHINSLKAGYVDLSMFQPDANDAQTGIIDASMSPEQVLQAMPSKQQLERVREEQQQLFAELYEQTAQ